MCLIVDTNRFSAVFGLKSDATYRPVVDWLFRAVALTDEKRLVFGGTKYNGELEKHTAASQAILELFRAGLAKLVPMADVDKEQERVTDHCASDDPHVVALGRLSGARTLVSEDADLIKDWTNRALVPGVKGIVYRSDKHKALLAHTEGCPSPPGPVKKARKEGARRRKQGKTTR